MFSLITIVSAVVIEAAIHWYVIEKKRKDPKDNVAFTFTRTMLYIFIATAFAGATYQWTLDYVFLLIGWCGSVAIVRWSLFDYLLNLMRGKPLYYLGNETIDDKIEAKFNGTLVLIVKLVVFILISLLII